MKKKKNEQCEYLHVCEHVKELCQKIKHCHKKCDQENLVLSKSGISFCKTFEQCTIGKTGKYYTRSHGHREIKKHNLDFGNKISAYNKLWMSMPDDFKDDCRRYAKLAFQKSDKEKYSLNCINIFHRALSRHKNQILNAQDICVILGNTLNEWINRGFLEKVSDNETFSAKILPD